MCIAINNIDLLCSLSIGAQGMRATVAARVVLFSKVVNHLSSYPFPYSKDLGTTVARGRSLRGEAHLDDCKASTVAGVAEAKFGRAVINGEVSSTQQIRPATLWHYGLCGLSDFTALIVRTTIAFCTGQRC